MAGQDIGFFDTGGNCPDLVIENGDLKADDGLETAVMISLFSDRFTSNEDLPEGIINPRGWWADNLAEPEGDLIGSRFWNLALAKVTQQTLNDFEQFASEALNWMIRDGIALTVTPSALRNGLERIDIGIRITKPADEDTTFKFVWDGQELKVS